MNSSIDLWSLAFPMFQQGEDPIECINKAMAFLSAVASRKIQSYAGTGNRGIATTSKGNVVVGPQRVVKCYNCQGEEAQEAGQILDEKQLTFLADPDDLDSYDSDCDDLSSTKAVLMANLSRYDLEVLSEPLTNGSGGDCQGGMTFCEVGLSWERDGFVLGCRSRGESDSDDE
ncbi:hypothetical protein Tco_1330113 [Tanacetum coccineum]